MAWLRWTLKAAVADCWSLSRSGRTGRPACTPLVRKLSHGFPYFPPAASETWDCCRAAIETSKLLVTGVWRPEVTRTIDLFKVLWQVSRWGRATGEVTGEREACCQIGFARQQGHLAHSNLGYHTHHLYYTQRRNENFSCGSYSALTLAKEMPRGCWQKNWKPRSIHSMSPEVNLVVALTNEAIWRLSVMKWLWRHDDSANKSAVCPGGCYT